MKELNHSKVALLFQNMTTGFALHEIILDAESQPCDYRFLEINTAFEMITGFSAIQLIGNTVMQIMPNTEPYWMKLMKKNTTKGKTNY